MRSIRLVSALLVGIASLVIVPVLASPANAATTCYGGAVSKTVYIEPGTTTEVIGPFSRAGTPCHDVNLKRTNSIGFDACVIHTYEGQTDCTANTYIGTNWIVPTGGPGVRGQSFKVKVQVGTGGKTLQFLLAY
jgi:hypothetical protein